MPPKSKKSGSRSNKNGGPKKGVKRSTADYCTLLDKMYNNKDTKEVVSLILSEKYCMGSMFTRKLPMVFICPNKLSDISDVQDLKSHMLKGKVGEGSSLMTYAGEYKNWLMRNVDSKSGGKIVVDGVDCSLVFNHQDSAVYKASGKLPAAKAGKSLAQEGGGVMEGITHMYNELTGAELNRGMVLRQSIVKKYQQKFPPYMYDYNHMGHWSNRLYSGLVLHLNEGIPNFGDVFLPMLNKEKPWSALEPLLQYRIKASDDSSDKQSGGGHSPYFVNDSYLQSFMKSPYFLSADDNIISQSYDLHDMFLKSVYNNSRLYHENPIHMQDIIQKYAGDLFNDVRIYGGDGGYFDTDNDGYPTHPDMTNKIVTAYKKVYGDLDHSNPGQYSLYKKVYDKAPLVKLHLDLQRFVTSMGDPDHHKRDGAMSVLYGSKYLGEQLELVLNSGMSNNSSSRYGQSAMKLLEDPKYLREFMDHYAFHTYAMSFVGDESYLKKNTSDKSVEPTKQAGGMAHALAPGHAEMENAAAQINAQRQQAYSQMLQSHGLSNAKYEVLNKHDPELMRAPMVNNYQRANNYPERYIPKPGGKDSGFLSGLLGL